MSIKCWTVPSSVDSVLNATRAVLVFSMIFTFPYDIVVFYFQAYA